MVLGQHQELGSPSRPCPASSPHQGFTSSEGWAPAALTWKHQQFGWMWQQFGWMWQPGQGSLQEC